MIRVHPSPETHVLWQPIFQRTLSLVHAVWNSTRGVLSASPAEHSSEDAVDHEEARALLAIEASGNSQGEDGEGGVGLRHQIVLSWAWRAIKESRSVDLTFLAFGLPRDFYWSHPNQLPNPY